MTTIDLNCDMGEGDLAADRALLEFVSSANIACGGHAGDKETMRAVVAMARDRGVAIGAHPGYPDRAGFGRIEIPMAAREVEAFVEAQVRALDEIARAAGAALSHVKPHGALYHVAMKRPEIAGAIAAGAARVRSGLMLVGIAGGEALDWWRGDGVPVVAEAFADRLYEADGSLRARTRAGAVITDPTLAAEQAVRIAEGRGVVALDGTTLAVRAETICIHGDTPGAPAVARSVREALTARGIRVAKPGS